MQKYTKYLFFISLFLSFVSLYVMGKGGKEIYPFFSWKLFTSPSGNEKLAEQYRLYRINGNDTIRLSYNATELYDENNLGLITSFYGRKIDNNEDRKDNIRKMKTFIKSYLLEDENIFLYKESFSPWELGKPSFKIKKIQITKL
ncbi:hypothetical protein ASG22_04145 [Chryseobacterium sp. Leaf405]|uniref:hypothetical protein n=1 Tax=Chryseobacterium sp. Leaf405 TaxID=1736367 RepID=UPI0006F9E01C|nr:hypothetical protein [Chryseobacterium sp. Leaf405]KQT25896.1 hypothetical protein ASG22_04145 [Chryseobacterium sp. Leaf405]